MTDHELIRKLKQIELHRQKVTDLIYSIEESEHPNAAEIADELWQQCWFAADAEHVIGTRGLLARPERWELEVRERGSGETYVAGLVRKKVA